MILVDTNIICLRWLPAAETNLADALFERDHDWASALLWRWEFRNALIGYVRRGSLTRNAAIELSEKAEAAMTGREFDARPEDVFDLVGNSNCTAYDCEFVAVARDHGVRLITADRQLLREFPSFAISLTDFLAA